MPVKGIIPRLTVFGGHYHRVMLFTHFVLNVNYSVLKSNYLFNDIQCVWVFSSFFFFFFALKKRNYGILQIQT